MDLPRETGLAILGGGPSAFGLLTYAYRFGRLDDLTRPGLLLLERGDTLGSGALGRYRITANSWAESFLHHGLNSDDEELKRLVETPEGQALLAYRGRPFPLPLGAAFLRRLARMIADRIAARPGCGLFTGARVERLRRRRGGWRVEGRFEQGQERLFSFDARKVVLATGAVQSEDSGQAGGWPTPALSHHGAPSITSQRVIEADEGELDTLFPPGRPARIVVLGGSHSALSAAKKLHEHGSSRFAITIVHRSPLRFYYASEAEAREDGADPGPDQVCGLSGRVNRFSGLRYDALAFARECLEPASEASRSVRFRHVPEGAGESDEALAREIEAATHIVTALGFRRREVEILDESGRPLRPLAASDGALETTGEGRLLGEGGRPFPDLFAIGLGAGLRTSPEVGGEMDRRVRVDGVWMYQNDAAKAVVEPLLAELDALPSAGLRRR